MSLPYSRSAHWLVCRAFIVSRVLDEEHDIAIDAIDTELGGEMISIREATL